MFEVTGPASAAKAKTELIPKHPVKIRKSHLNKFPIEHLPVLHDTTSHPAKRAITSLWSKAVTNVFDMEKERGYFELFRLT